MTPEEILKVNIPTGVPLVYTFDRDFNVNSAVNNPNDYTGPQTGYQITPEKWENLKTIRQAVSPESI